jgi:hypothetical protein
VRFCVVFFFLTVVVGWMDGWMDGGASSFSRPSLYTTKTSSSFPSQCTAAFARALLTPGAVPPGVWSPEALPAGARAAVLADAAGGAGRVKGRARRFELGRADWEIATEPTRLGFGIYV